MIDQPMVKDGDGRFSVIGGMNFQTVNRLLRDASRMFDGCAVIEIDLAKVDHSDSAGLALLIEWLKNAERANKEIRFTHVSEQLYAIARISELDQVLSLDD